MGQKNTTKRKIKHVNVKYLLNFIHIRGSSQEGTRNSIQKKKSSGGDVLFEKDFTTTTFFFF